MRWRMALLALAVLLVPVAAQQVDRSKLVAERQAFSQAYNRKDWPRAIEVGLRIDQLLPNNSTHQYNMACVYALNGDADTAETWLGRAAVNGFLCVSLMERDTDLESIRQRPGCTAALQQARKNLEQLHARLRETYTKHPPRVLVPPEFDRSKPAPLIIALHGYGDHADGAPLYWRNVAAEIGAVLVAPQGPYVVPGAHRSWVPSGTQRVDDGDYVILHTLEDMRRRFKVDEKRIVLTGFSQGAFIAFSAVVRHPELFCGVIPMAGGYVPAMDAPPPAGEQAPRFYFMVGAKDPVAPQDRRAVNDFRTAGYTVELRVYPATGHAFPNKDRQEELRKALRYALGE
ncbi:MAG: dienelactone hydrolase family protein [Phycisphaerae bacterium]